METVKVIKRYQNRKLYDPESSHYITLNTILSEVLSGVALKIINNKTQEDMTNVIILSALVEQSKLVNAADIPDLLNQVADYISKRNAVTVAAAANVVGAGATNLENTGGING